MLYTSSRHVLSVTFVTSLATLLAFGCGSSSNEEGQPETPADSGTASDGSIPNSSSEDAGNEAATEPDAGGIVPGPVDAIIDAMPPGSWKELSGTNMADVCPQPYSKGPCEAVVAAWSGGAYDTLRDRLIVWGGGHADSPYNNVFTFDLASMTWKRWTDLSSLLSADIWGPLIQDKRVESCGLYPAVANLSIPAEWLTATGYLQIAKCDDPSIVTQLDQQQPRSAHSYGNINFSPATGRFYILGSVATYATGQTLSQRVSSFDFATSQWSRGANNPGAGYGASAVDANGHIWHISGSNADPKLHEYDPKADTWTTHAPDGEGYYYAGADVDTKRNILAMTADGASISTYALSDAAKTHATVKPTGLGTSLGPATGFAYSPKLDRFVAWAGGQSVPILDLPSAKWTVFPGTGDDPGPQAALGTYGRFRYSPARNVFVVVSSTTRNVFLWKPPATAP